MSAIRGVRAASLGLVRTTLSLTASSTGHSQARQRSAPTVTSVPDIPYTRLTLKNGLTLLVDEDHKASIVEAGLRELNLGPLTVLDADGNPAGAAAVGAREA